MLKEAQKEFLVQGFKRLAGDLTKDQLRQLYFRLDDLIQYGENALPIAHKTISEMYKIYK